MIQISIPFFNWILFRVLFLIVTNSCVSLTDDALDVRNQVRWSHCGHGYKCQRGSPGGFDVETGPGFCNSIDRDQLCDGRVNCRLGDDEHKCRPTCPWFKPHSVPNSFCCLKLATDRCNFRVDCADGSDEWNCQKCRFDDQSYGYKIPGFNYIAKFRCDNGHCVYDVGPDDGDYFMYATLRCDGKTDCEDDSDEQGCGSFGVSHCLKGVAEDEVDTKLETLWGRRRFLCEPENKCIPEAFLCNGASDCGSGMDERDCRHRCPRHRPHLLPNTSCCVSKHQICDGIRHCYPPETETRFIASSSTWKNMSPDEKDCKKKKCPDDRPIQCHHQWEFLERKGSTVKCIFVHQQCDGIPDCDEASDETNCTKCHGDAFLCSDGRCIPESKRCDGIVDCSNDELCDSCPSDRPWRCKWKHRYTKKGRRYLPTKCISLSQRCNGMKPGFFPTDGIDCRWTNPEDVSDHKTETNSDYSDEVNCSPTTCQGVLCSCGICIHESYRCNAVDDCTRICSKYRKDKSSYQSEFANVVFNVIDLMTPSSDEANCTTCQNGMLYPDPNTGVTFPFSDHEVFGAFHIERLEKCIPVGQRCDGCKDLDAGEDEENCHYGFPLADLGFENCPITKRSVVANQNTATTEHCSLSIINIHLLSVCVTFFKLSL